MLKPRRPLTADSAAVARLHRVSLRRPAITGFHGRNRYTPRCAIAAVQPVIQVSHNSQPDMLFSLTAVNFRKMIFAAFH